jgi:hypothetical protein
MSQRPIYKGGEGGGTNSSTVSEVGWCQHSCENLCKNGNELSLFLYNWHAMSIHQSLPTIVKIYMIIIKNNGILNSLSLPCNFCMWAPIMQLETIPAINKQLRIFPIRSDPTDHILWTRGITPTIRWHAFVLTYFKGELLSLVTVHDLLVQFSSQLILCWSMPIQLDQTPEVARFKHKETMKTCMCSWI